jgi:tetratricopeptide (TPR) repeat protein
MTVSISLLKRGLCLCLTLLLVVLLFASCSTMEQKRDKFFAEGKEYYQKGDYIKARLQFTNALQIDPKFPEAYFWLGKTELKLGNARGAYGSLTQAVELKPNLTEAQIMLGQLLLLAKQVDRAEEKSKLALKQEPHNPDALILAASVAQTRGHSDQALKFLAEARRLKPDLIAGYVGAATIETKLKHPEAAAAVLDEGIKANPKSPELLLARASLADAQKDFAGGESYLLRATELEPQNPKLKMDLARHYLLAAQPEKAEKALRANLALEPDNETHVIALVQFLSKEGRQREAEQTLKDFIAHHPNNYPARFTLADYYISRGQPGRGEKVLQEIINLDPHGNKGMEAKNQLAKIRLTQGHVEEAQKLVADILKDNPKDMTATQTQGLIALAQKDGLKAVNSFRIVAQDKPQNPKVWLLLARAHWLNKEPEQAKEMAKKALEIKPDFLEARRFLYNLFLENKDYSGAIQTIQGYLRLNDKDIFNLTALGETYVQAGNNAKARETFQKIVTLDPKNPQGYFDLGLLSLKMKKKNEAVKYLEKALAVNPNFIPALQLLVAYYQEQTAPDKALAVVKQSVSHNPKNPQLQQMLGEVLLVQNQPKAAAAALEEALKLSPKVAVLRLLTLAYLKEPDHDQVLGQLEKRVADPKSPPIYFLVLASLYEKQQKVDKAMALYNTLVERDLFPDLARNNLAYLLAENRPTPENLTRALKLSGVTLEDNPEEPSFLDTYGWILCKQGDFAKAKHVLERAVEHSSDQPTLLYHLGWCEAKLKETKAARAALQKALAAKGEFLERQEAEKLLNSLPAESKP